MDSKFKQSKQAVEVDGIDTSNASVTTLSLETWEQCTLDANDMNATARNIDSNKLKLGPYAVPENYTER